MQLDSQNTENQGLPDTKPSYKTSFGYFTQRFININRLGIEAVDLDLL